MAIEIKDMLTLLELGLLVGAALAGYVLAKQQSEKRTIPMMRSVEAIQKVLLPPMTKDSAGVEEAITPIWQQLSNMDGTLKDLRDSHRINDQRLVQVDQKLLNVESRLTGVDNRLVVASTERQQQGELLGKIDSRVTLMEAFAHSVNRRGKKVKGSAAIS